MGGVVRVIANGLLAFWIWPGLLGSAACGWLYLWWARKLAARAQGRVGPPFYQPFFDFVKLMGKETLVPSGIHRGLFWALPAVALLVTTGALALLPLPGNPAADLPGDLIVVVFLLEAPMLCDVLAGFATRSIYGQLGSAREALLSLGYNLPFLTALIALGMRAGSFRLEAIAALPVSPVHLFAGIALLLALPARFKTNPFSIPNAEQEIMAGMHIEYNGAALGLFELAHALEFSALTGLLAVLWRPEGLPAPVGLILYVLSGLLTVSATSLLAAATARFKVQHALSFYWRWGAAAAILALVSALLR